MKNQLMQLQILLTFVDPELANYLGLWLSHVMLLFVHSCHMYCCQSVSSHAITSDRQSANDVCDLSYCGCNYTVSTKKRPPKHV